MFLCISKAFDKIWYLVTFGISDDFLELLNNLLSNEFQRVVLNGQTSEQEKINPGRLQGSIVEPLFFLSYIND